MVIADRHVRVNERIRAKEVRVIDDEGKQLGIMPPYEALKVARAAGLDLVEVSPTANPPVCRIIDYGKYQYQQSKRQQEARKHQKSLGLKEIKMRINTSEHDLEVKRNNALRFLQDGNKVKATVIFRGRENTHRDLGYQLLRRLVEQIGEVGIVEAGPRSEGPTLSAILAPKKGSAKSAPATRPATNSARMPTPATKPATTSES